MLIVTCDLKTLLLPLLLFRHRLRVCATAREIGNVRAACRIHGIHHSSFYRSKALVDRQGLEMLRPRALQGPSRNEYF
jgi:hypothetical protein